MKLIADNLRITKTDIQDALKAFDPKPIQELVKHCVEKGAFAIDVNTGPLGKSPEEGMAFFIEAVQSVTDLPLLIDTSNPVAMKAGLEAANNKIIINGFSLEPHKLEKILPLAEEYDADIVGFLLYPDSRVPKNEDERFEIALELFEQADAAGVSKDRIIIDPWDRSCCRDCRDSCKGRTFFLGDGSGIKKFRPDVGIFLYLFAFGNYFD